jgi:hypothetical protein
MEEKYKSIKLCPYKSLAGTLVVEGVEGRVTLMKGMFRSCKNTYGALE